MRRYGLAQKLLFFVARPKKNRRAWDKPLRLDKKELKTGRPDNRRGDLPYLPHPIANNPVGHWWAMAVTTGRPAPPRSKISGPWGLQARLAPLLDRPDATAVYMRKGARDVRAVRVGCMCIAHVLYVCV
jgi:hypothetical protein